MNQRTKPEPLSLEQVCQASRLPPGRATGGEKGLLVDVVRWDYFHQLVDSSPGAHRAQARLPLQVSPLPR